MSFPPTSKHGQGGYAGATPRPRILAVFLVLLYSIGTEGQRLSPLQEYFQNPADHGGPSDVFAGDDFKVYHNLWFHNMRMYAITEPSSGAPAIKPEVTVNTGIVSLPVTSATEFHQNLKTGQVTGNTLLLDFPFQAFPENMGHWAEILAPAYSVLSAGRWREHVDANSSGQPHLDAVLLVNLRREQLQGLGWVREMLRLTVAPALPEGAEMPRIIHSDELDFMDKAWWLAFQYVIVAHDRYMHPEGRGGFATPEMGHAFRRAAYAHAGIDWPAGATSAPRTITMLTAVGGEPVANVGQLVAALRDVGRALGMRVRPFSVTTGAPFASFVSVMARTGVLISRHGPLLANTMFLPPGAVVLELLPYNWDWKGISEIYVNLTRSLHDVHHFAWRARHPRWARYSQPDEQRYADWTAEECSSRDCLEVHARAEMVADSDTVQEMLMDCLPQVFRGASVRSLAQPWPSARHNPATETGLWWDK